MGDYLSNLPDDILTHILSSLTVRDSFRLRSLSPTLKHLPDTRSVLLFDAYTILGKPQKTSSRTSIFVQALDHFFTIWKPQKTTTLEIKFNLGNQYASHIHAWIATVIGNQIQELDLDFHLFLDSKVDKYIFPFYIFHTKKGSSLKHFRLKFCDITFIPHVHTSWLNKLSTVELIDVTLDSSGLECILSNTVNLESLTLKHCDLNGDVCVQHPSLKKLVILDRCLHLELICPHLEILEYSGFTYFTFSRIPLLREASLKLNYHIREGSPVFSELAGSAPCLQTLYLLVTTEILPVVPQSLTMSCLKRLDLLTILPSCFDIFTITQMLYSSPVLEELHLKRDPNMVPLQRPQRRYVNRPHSHLREVKFEGVWAAFRCFELADYLFKNCLALQQMIFEVGDKASPIFRALPDFTVLQNNNPTVKLIVV
ncbi:hypothetical protein KSS87_017164 [Heliosperma pusillum]|nr:hypothetical protein KSS87_017164 [Heliosperma pusillum]